MNVRGSMMDSGVCVARKTEVSGMIKDPEERKMRKKAIKLQNETTSGFKRMPFKEAMKKIREAQQAKRNPTENFTRY